MVSGLLDSWVVRLWSSPEAECSLFQHFIFVTNFEIKTTVSENVEAHVGTV